MEKKDTFLYDIVVGFVILFIASKIAIITQVILSIFVNTPEWYHDGGNLTKLYSFVYPLFGLLMLVSVIVATYFIFSFFEKKRTFKSETTTAKNKFIIKCLIIIVIFTISKLLFMHNYYEDFLDYWVCYITGLIDSAYVTPDINYGTLMIINFVNIFIESIMLFFAMYYGKKSGEKKGLKARMLSRQKIVGEQPSAN